MSHDPSHGHSNDDEFDVHVHISSTKLNVGILMSLFALTGLTIAAYLVRLGDANLTIALLIATIKAVLVGTFFMHLKYEKPFNTLFFVGTLLFIAVFFVFTHNDTGHRAELDYRNGARFDYRYQEWAQGIAEGIRERNGEELRPTPAAEGAAAEAAPATEAQ